MPKKLAIFLPGIALSLLLVLPASLVYGGDQPPGKPFEYLNSRVDDLESRTGSLEERLSQAEADLEALKNRVVENEGDIGDLYESIADLEEEIAAIKDELLHNGKKVAPGLYHVHKRVLWDVGWLTNQTCLTYNLYLAYNELEVPPTYLRYGNCDTLILSPLKGYGVPAIPEGATRKVRLFATYSHQWMCNGSAVAVDIGGVEFDLPLIHGAWIHPASNWSNFREYSEYEHVGHTSIKIYLKDYVWGGSHCAYSSGSNRGAVYRIEAHFYDEYPE